MDIRRFTLHQRLTRHLRAYFFVGGMPEAVANYVEHRNLERVQSIHREILTAYELDIAKHAPRGEAQRIYLAWNSIPSQLARENRKFKYALSRGVS